MNAEIKRRYRLRKNMKTTLSPGKVCAKYAEKNVRVKIAQLDDEYMLIEGSAEALEFLGKLFLAQSNFKQDCGFNISPKGAGSALFKRGSTVGLYIHRLPCLEKKSKPIRVRKTTTLKK